MFLIITFATGLYLTIAIMLIWLVFVGYIGLLLQKEMEKFELKNNQNTKIKEKEMKNSITQKKELVKSICEHYFNAIAAEERLNKFWKVELMELYNLLTKYILLGGKLPSKYEIETNFKVDSNIEEFINNPKLYTDILYISHLNFKPIIEDIADGKLELESVEHFSEADMNKILELSKEFIALQKLKNDTEKKYREIFSELTNLKDPTLRDRTIAFMNLVLIILNNSEE